MQGFVGKYDGEEDVCRLIVRTKEVMGSLAEGDSRRVIKCRIKGHIEGRSILYAGIIHLNLIHTPFVTEDCKYPLFGKTRSHLLCASRAAFPDGWLICPERHSS